MGRKEATDIELTNDTSTTTGAAGWGDEPETPRRRCGATTGRAEPGNRME